MTYFLEWLNNVDDKSKRGELIRFYIKSKNFNINNYYNIYSNELYEIKANLRNCNASNYEHLQLTSEYLL